MSFVTPQLILEHEQVAKTIRERETHQSGARLKTIEAQIKNINKQLSGWQNKLPELEENTAKYEEKWKVIENDDWYFGKYISGKKGREEKAADRKSKLEAAKAAQAECITAISRLSDEKGSLQKEAHGLANQVGDLKSLKEREKFIVDTLFAYGTPLADAQEVQLRYSVAAVIPPLNVVMKYRASYAKAYEHLHKAVVMLKEAAGHLQSATGLNRVGMVNNAIRPGMRAGLGGTMADAAMMRQTQEGVEMAKAACEQIKIAKKLCPDVPRVDLAKVQGFQAMFLNLMMAGSLMVDMMQARKIAENMAQVQDMLEDCRAGEKWMKHQLTNKIDVDLAKLQNDYGRFESDLQAHRRVIIARAAAAINAGQPYLQDHPLAMPQSTAMGMPVGTPTAEPCHAYPGLAAIGYGSGAAPQGQSHQQPPPQQQQQPPQAYYQQPPPGQPYPPQGYPPQGGPPAPGYPLAPPQGYPAYPPQGYPPQPGYPPSGSAPQAQPPRDPSQEHAPPPGYPTTRAPPPDVMDM